MPSAFRGLAAFAGLVFAAIAAVAGIIFAFFFAATVVAIGIVGAIVVAFAALAMRVRRSLKRSPKTGDDGVIEAQRVGGHSWVAYGWDNRR